MFRFCKRLPYNDGLLLPSNILEKPVKPIEPVETVKPVEPISPDEQELRDLEKMVDKPYDRDTFLFFLNHFQNDSENLKEDNWPYVWFEFKKSIWLDAHLATREGFKAGSQFKFNSSKKYILAKFIETFTTELLKKCRERYQEFYQNKEIKRMFSLPPEKSVNLLKLKEAYGQDVFWSEFFLDYKPFDAKDWLEDGESL